MKVFRKLSYVLFSVIVWTAGLPCRTDAAPPIRKTPIQRVLTRIFFQDDESKSLKWADLLSGEHASLVAVGEIRGFPEIDTKRQSLVQMQCAQGKLLVGIRDDEDGKFQSGWVLIDTGVDEDDHGDHSHWNYARTPAVVATMLDANQGNPAHVYCYDEVFYLANDKLDGFTRLDPSTVKPGDDTSSIRGKAVQFRGGGGHITLAAVNGEFAYSTWIERDGPNKGRVDVTALALPGNRKVNYSFFLPYGGIHGAVSCQGKVFFAPSDGICWTLASSDPTLDPRQIQVHHITLGKDGEKPRRAGSFDFSGKCVGFVAGSGANAMAGFIDASKSQISVIQVPLDLAKGSRPVGPSIVKPRHGSRLAFIFHDHEADVATKCKLSLVELNCASNGDLNSAKLLQVIDVGNCRVDGHSGHHDVDFDGERRYAIFTNPGDGTLSLLSLEDRKIVADLKVGGIPSKVICVGGAGSRH